MSNDKFSNWFGYDHDCVSASAPTVNAPVITNIAWNDFDMSSSCSNGGASITAHGFLISPTNSTPTIGGTATNQYQDTSIGQTSFSYNAALSSINATTTYYVRAYATNSVGTTYSQVVTVQTYRRGHVLRKNTTKFGIDTVCTELSSQTYYFDSGAASGVELQQGNTPYLNANPGNNAKPTDSTLWLSDTNWKRRWGGGTASWTSSATQC